MNGTKKLKKRRQETFRCEINVESNNNSLVSFSWLIKNVEDFRR